VVDTDGQFLLIEAANYIPKWIKPENSQNRVWIQGGHIHIIPLPTTPIEITVLPFEVRVSDAIKIIDSSIFATRASEEVENAIFSKIAGYVFEKGVFFFFMGCFRFPQKAWDSIHHSRISLPRSIAYILKKEPQILSHAIRSFYYRDTISMRACGKMKRFGYDEKYVMTSVQFTKCSYAQMALQNFHPPKILRSKLPEESHPDYKAISNGIKITCGFEMLYQEGKAKERKEGAKDFDITVSCLILSL